MNSNLSPEQMKGLTSVHRRINNLETRYGGTIHKDSLGKWWSQKEKLLNEAESIRQGGAE